ncbi:hypothetical protein LOTGIDRAFT_166440 [Lottia gigantea]|uniref:Ig-like domain-containing protein n=1 Tax=Lottia gigantea TaxID=225164 RepID=V3ZY45_LOTGI|nr:hypothetical protein LOTGIDRAFT_166440 [Lottia gigantea]ESO87560.1 hypothetical protein LOTGIDRAFT_166440 [Lottia gigantea]
METVKQIIEVDAGKSRKRQLKPSFVSDKTNITVHAGEEAVLPCSIHYVGTREVSWKRKGEDFFLTIGLLTWAREDEIKVDHKQHAGELSDWNLVINPVKMEDAGIYECSIIAKRKQTHRIKLNVLKARKKQEGMTLTGNRFINLGEKVVLLCNATGGHLIPEEIDWFKDGDIIHTELDKSVRINKKVDLKSRSLISELIVERSKVTDSGTYICRSSNEDIDSLDVTVLVADSSNVKRGTDPLGGAQTDHHYSSGCFKQSESYVYLTTLLMCILTYHNVILWPDDV